MEGGGAEVNSHEGIAKRSVTDIKLSDLDDSPPPRYLLPTTLEAQLYLNPLYERQQYLLHINFTFDKNKTEELSASIQTMQQRL